MDIILRSVDLLIDSNACDSHLILRTSLAILPGCLLVDPAGSSL